MVGFVDLNTMEVFSKAVVNSIESEVRYCLVSGYIFVFVASVSNVFSPFTTRRKAGLIGEYLLCFVFNKSFDCSCAV